MVSWPWKEEVVGEALLAQSRGNAQPAARALTSVRAIRRHLNRLELVVKSADRPTLRRIRDYLDQQERRLEQRDMALRPST